VAPAKRSAGILLYRFVIGAHPAEPGASAMPGGSPEVLLVHPGGPFWARKDAGVWSIPKGEYEDGDDPLASALREFEEETGTALPPGELIELGDVKQRGGKLVSAWAAEGDLDADAVHSNTFTMELPPRSGRTAEFPEIDRAGWFGIEEAREKLNPAQAELLERLLDRLPA
jgi:predicted NUDIX family NTP pyrophosphohydrolase